MFMGNKIPTLEEGIEFGEGFNKAILEIIFLQSAAYSAIDKDPAGDNTKSVEEMSKETLVSSYMFTGAAMVAFHLRETLRRLCKGKNDPKNQALQELVDHLDQFEDVYKKISFAHESTKDSN